MGGPGGKGSTRPDPSVVRSGWQDPRLLRILAYDRSRGEALLASHDRRNPATIGKPFNRPAAGLGEEAKTLFLNSTARRRAKNIDSPALDYGRFAQDWQFSSAAALPLCQRAATLPKAGPSRKRGETSPALQIDNFPEHHPHTHRK
jgi:hypothetical protein